MSGAICAVGYQYHASELLDDARTLLDGQQVGLLISRNFGPVAGRPWFMDRAQGGGQILERGEPSHRPAAGARRRRSHRCRRPAGSVDLSQTDAPNGIEDAIALVFQFENGAIGSVHSAWTRAGQPELYGVDIVASDATLALQLGPKAFRLTGRAGGADVAREHGEPMDRSIERFVDAVRAGDQSLVACQPAVARDTLAVALACERALESGGHVEVEPMTPPRLTRIDHIGIVVADFDAHVAQLEALGLELRREGLDSDSHVRHYRSGDATIELIDVLDESARTRAARRGRAGAHRAHRVRGREPRGRARHARGPRRRGLVAALRVGERADDLDDGRDERRRAVPVLRATSGRAAGVRIGIVGAGAIARRHADSLRRRPDLEIAVVCDVDASRAASLADDVGARASTSWQDAIASHELDAVFICTPPALHADPAVACLERGLAVYLEKPLARSLEDGRRIVEAWQRSSAICAVGYQWRSLDLLAPLRAALRDVVPGLLVSRGFGPTELGRGDRAGVDAGPDGSWFVDPRRSGGILFELAQPRHRPAVRDRRSGRIGARRHPRRATWRSPASTRRASTTRWR